MSAWWSVTRAGPRMRRRCLAAGRVRWTRAATSERQCSTPAVWCKATPAQPACAFPLRGWSSSPPWPSLNQRRWHLGCRGRPINLILPSIFAHSMLMLKVNHCRSSTQAVGTESPASSWDELPSHLLEDILSLLPADQIRKSSQVSHHWRAASEAPLKSACLRAGLKMPASGVRTWSGLQAHAERLAMHWHGTPLGPTPTCTIPCPRKKRASWEFPSDSLCVNKNGIYVNGKERVFINLPKIGSNAPVHCTTLPLNAQPDQFNLPHFCGMRASEGYVIYEDFIHAFVGNSSKTPFAVTHNAPCPCSGASSGDLFATEHRDGVHLWSLPDLKPRAYIPDIRTIMKVLLSADGRCLIIRPLGITAYMWDVAEVICIKEIDCDEFFFDDRHANLLCLVRHHRSECRLERYSFAGALLNTCHVPQHYLSAYLSNPGVYIFCAENGSLQIFDDKNGSLSCNMPLGFDLCVTYPKAMATSQDGRWFSILNNFGDVIIWDISA
jgi:hypothetical protein